VLKNRWLLALITVVHRFLYVSSGGLVGARIFRIRFLLLQHVGRRTGRTRVTPLLYIEDGDRWIVTASNAGDDRHPEWWYNLQSGPEVQIQVGRRQIEVQWRQASPEECERLWPTLAAAYPYYPEYRECTEREIPVLILERAAATQPVRDRPHGYARGTA
jgi:deazaflavin-dependent oxidoreductase (nitroreductase family)